MRWWVGSLIFLSVQPLLADEAILPDGQRLRGTIAKQSPEFSSNERTIPFTDIQRILSTNPASSAEILPIFHRFQLVDGQLIHGEWLQLTNDRLAIRTSWQPRLEIERSALDDLQVAGRFRVSSISLPPLAPIDGPKHAQTITLARSIPAGRLAWTIGGLGLRGERELVIGGVRIGLIGNRLAVVNPADKSLSFPMSIGEERQQMIVEWSPTTLDVFLGDRVLYSITNTTTEPIKTIELRSAAEGVSGSLTFSQAFLAVPLDRSPLAMSRSDGDVLALSENDERFGTINGFDGQFVTWKSSMGPMRTEITRLNAIRWKRQNSSWKPTIGLHVRLQLRSWDGARDELIAVLQNITPTDFTLKHALFGPISIDRKMIMVMDILGELGQFPIDYGVRHLGKKARGDWTVMQPSGPSHEWPFVLDETVKELDVVLTARSVGPGSFVVMWNGQPIGRITPTGNIARQYRLPVPADLRNRGEESLRITCQPTETGGPIGNVQVEGVRIERKLRK